MVRATWRVAAEATAAGQRIRRVITHENAPLLVVTASDSSHFGALVGLLKSLRHLHRIDAIVVWDLGLSPEELRWLETHYPQVDLQTFDFSAHPPHLLMSNAAGSYAWKPVIIDRSVSEHSGLVAWLDAGDVLRKEPRLLAALGSHFGLYSPFSAGTIREWTHPATLAALQVEASLLSRSNVSGGIIIIDTSSARARQVISAWMQAALDVSIIAPPGSSRDNHRQDQSLLSCLMHQHRIISCPLLWRFTPGLGIRIHQDEVAHRPEGINPSMGQLSS